MAVKNGGPKDKERRCIFCSRGEKDGVLLLIGTFSLFFHVLSAFVFLFFRVFIV